MGSATRKRAERHVDGPGIPEASPAGVAVPYPKVQAVEILDDHTLLVAFENAHKRTYDVTPLLQKAMFAPLKNPVFFKSVQVERGGYAVVWNSEIDISEYELWSKGQPVP